MNLLTNHKALADNHKALAELDGELRLGSMP